MPPLREITALGGKPRAGLGLAGRPLDAWTLATELADPASEQLERSELASAVEGSHNPTCGVSG